MSFGQAAAQKIAELEAENAALKKAIAGSAPKPVAVKKKPVTKKDEKSDK